MKYNRRLFPKIWHSDYTSLIELRDTIKTVIDKYLPNKSSKLFDFGCGDLPYKPLFENKVAEYIGGDIAGNPDADIEITPESDIKLEDKSVDVVLSIQVLEHVPNVDNYLAEAHRVLKDDSLLLLSTHGWWTYHPFPTDLRRWTVEGLTYELNKHGFDVLDSYWVLGMLAYSSQLRVQCFKGLLDEKGFLLGFIFKVICSIYQISMILWDKITPDSIGKTNSAIYFMVAKKRK